MKIEHLNPSGLGTPAGFSHVTISSPGRMVHVAGQVARDAAGRVVGAGDLAAQAEQVYANLRIALEAAGAGWKDVVKVVTYVVDLTPEKAAAVRAVRNRHFGDGPLPASTMVGVTALVNPDLLVEIEVSAALD